MTDKIQTQRGEGDATRGAYERSDLDFRSSLLTLLGLFGLVALVCLGVAGLFSMFGTLRQPDAPRPHTGRSVPALQLNEASDRVASDQRAEGRNGRRSIADAMNQTAALGWDVPR